MRVLGEDLMMGVTMQSRIKEVSPPQKVPYVEGGMKENVVGWGT